MYFKGHKGTQFEANSLTNTGSREKNIPLLVVIYHIVHIDHIDVLRLVGYVIYVIYVRYVVNNYENK